MGVFQNQSCCGLSLAHEYVTPYHSSRLWGQVIDWNSWQYFFCKILPASGSLFCGLHTLGVGEDKAFFELGVRDDQYVLLVARHERDFVLDPGVKLVETRYNMSHVKPRSSILHHLRGNKLNSLRESSKKNQASPIEYRPGGRRSL